MLVAREMHRLRGGRISCEKSLTCGAANLNMNRHYTKCPIQYTITRPKSGAQYGKVTVEQTTIL